MAVILWILGVLLALIVLLCVTRVGVHAEFGETLLLDAKIGWFHIHILPAKEANKKKKEREKKAEDAEGTTEKAAKKPPFPKRPAARAAHKTPIPAPDIAQRPR